MSDEPKFTFGKYEGFRVMDVAVRYPRYLLWVAANVRFFKVPPEALKRAQDEIKGMRK